MGTARARNASGLKFLQALYQCPEYRALFNESASRLTPVGYKNETFWFPHVHALNWVSPQIRRDNLGNRYLQILDSRQNDATREYADFPTRIAKDKPLSPRDKLILDGKNNKPKYELDSESFTEDMNSVDSTPAD